MTHGLNDKQTFASHWGYISSIKNLQWFKLAEDIISIELGNKLVDLKYYLQFDRIVTIICDGVEKFIAGEITEVNLEQVFEQIDKNKKVRQENRQTRLAMRIETPHENYDFEEYFEDSVEWLIKDGLMNYHQDSLRYLDVWRKQRSECPFTENFLRGWLSTIYLSVVNHNLRLSDNDRADAEQLAYLQWADFMISDDTRFMREAFNLLYSKSEKCLMTLPQFLIYLDHL